MKEKYIKAHMETALVWAKLSHAKRRKVGSVLAREEHILSTGYNGTLAGEDNACETVVPDYDENGNYLGDVLVTHEEVIHAEENCIIKMVRSNETTVGSSLFITLSPCKKCARLIVMAEVKEVYYLEEYRDTSGITFLEKRGIPCYQVILE